MDYDEKTTLSIDGDGNVLKCAKGASASECGFVAGAELCGKCGAVPVEMKMIPVDMADEEAVAEQQMMPKMMHGAMPKKKGSVRLVEGMEGGDLDEADMADEEDDSTADTDGDEGEGGAVKPMRLGKAGAMERTPLRMDAEEESVTDEEPEAEEDDYLTEEEKELLWTINQRRKARGLAATTNGMNSKGDMEVDAEDMPEEDDEEDDLTEEEKELLWTVNKRRKARGMTATTNGMGQKGNMANTGNELAGMMIDEEDEEEMTEEEKELLWAANKRRRSTGKPYSANAMGDKADAAEDDEEEDDEEEMMATLGEKAFSPRDAEWSELRSLRVKSLGIKPSDIGTNGYLCAVERKAYAGSTPVCDDCPGGCVAEKGLPGILHVEGLAEKMFDGVVIDSGYSQDADMFVVDVQTKDGGVKEVFVDGTTAEVMGFHKLDSSGFEQKSDFAEYKLIDFTEAAEIAVKSIDGHVIAVEPDVFEGFDSYAVEIEGFDGKSYDVFVSLDGEVLGYDKYEQDEAEQIEAEAAEIALKRAFPEERRMELAKEGMALSDGSYPIVNETDLRNAIQAFGRAKDKEATKKHIMKRARALNMESIIPANWIAGGKEKSEELNDAEFMASLVEFQLLEESLDDN